MNDGILCLACFCLVLWVWLLKARILSLEGELKKLKARIKLGIQSDGDDVKIVRGRQSWGKKVDLPGQHAVRGG